MDRWAKSDVYRVRPWLEIKATLGDEKTVFQVKEDAVSLYISNIWDEGYRGGRIFAFSDSKVAILSIGAHEIKKTFLL